MDLRRILLGDPDARHRIAGAIVIAFISLFLLYAAYWRGTYADTGVTTLHTAIRAVTPPADISHSIPVVMLFLPTVALAIFIHYHGGAVLFTLAAGPVLPVASALARVIFSPQPDVLEIDVFRYTLPTHIRLGLGLGALAVIVGSVLRYWKPPNERSLSEHFLGPSVDYYRALAVIFAVGVVAAIFTLWVFTPYRRYSPITFAVFGSLIAAIVYWRWRTVGLAWLGNAAVVLGHAAGKAIIGAAPDYVLDPGFFVPALMTAATFGTLGVGAVIVFSELYAVVTHRTNTV